MAGWGRWFLALRIARNLQLLLGDEQRQTTVPGQKVNKNMTATMTATWPPGHLKSGGQNSTQSHPLSITKMWLLLGHPFFPGPGVSPSLVPSVTHRPSCALSRPLFCLGLRSGSRVALAGASSEYGQPAHFALSNPLASHMGCTRCPVFSAFSIFFWANKPQHRQSSVR